MIPGSARSPAGGNGNPFQYSCLENPMGRGAWWAPVQGVAKESDTTEQLSTVHSGVHITEGMAGCQLFHLGQTQVASFPGLCCYLERNSGSSFGLQGSAIPTPLSDFTLMPFSPLISRHRDLPFDLQVRPALCCLGDLTSVPSANVLSPAVCMTGNSGLSSDPPLQRTFPGPDFATEPNGPLHLPIIYFLSSFFCFCCCFRFFYLILAAQGLCVVRSLLLWRGLWSGQAQELQ